MSPKVSILVPVYKVSCYIEKCAESLFNQTFTDIEFIFVDDCSPDDSIEKLIKLFPKFPNRKDQIKIIRNDANKGISATRRIALEASSGSFISFIDSDDYVDSTMIEEMYEIAITENADIVLSGMYYEFGEKSVLIQDSLSPTKNQQFIDILTNSSKSNSLWDKLFQRSLLTDSNCLAPSELIYAEDWFTSIRLFYFAKNIVILDKAFYHYTCNNPLSITKTITEVHFDNLQKFWELTEKFLIEQGVFKKYEEQVQLQKVKSKIKLMMGTKSYTVRKKYAHLYFNKELSYLNGFRWGDKILLISLHYKMYFLAHIVQKLVFLKNKLY